MVALRVNVNLPNYRKGVIFSQTLDIRKAGTIIALRTEKSKVKNVTGALFGFG